MSGKDNINTINAVYEAFGRGDVGFIVGGTEDTAITAAALA